MSTKRILNTKEQLKPIGTQFRYFYPPMQGCTDFSWSCVTYRVEKYVVASANENGTIGIWAEALDVIESEPVEVKLTVLFCGVEWHLPEEQFWDDLPSDYADVVTAYRAGLIPEKSQIRYVVI